MKCLHCNVRPRYRAGIYCRACRLYVVLETKHDTDERRRRVKERSATERRQPRSSGT